MGLIRGTFSLSNPTRPDLAPLGVSALVNSVGWVCTVCTGVIWPQAGGGC